MVLASASQLIEQHNQILDLTRQRDMYKALYEETAKELLRAKDALKQSADEMSEILYGAPVRAVEGRLDDDQA